MTFNLNKKNQLKNLKTFKLYEIFSEKHKILDILEIILLFYTCWSNSYID